MIVMRHATKHKGDKTMRLTRKLSRDEQEIRRTYVAMGRRFDACAWPGGYTLEYVTACGDVLCADCATKAMRSERICREPRNGFLPIAYGTYDEGPTVNCADCNCMIESSYGDPDDDNGQD
jgi:hypothetical protein